MKVLAMSKAITPGIGHLTAATQRWIKAVHKEFELTEAEGRLLILSGETWDRLCQIRAILKKDGLLVVDAKGDRKKHPLADAEIKSRGQFAALLKELNLPIDGDSVPQIPSKMVGNRLRRFS